ncbi:MAG: rhomboid family intramembrane serine protease [Thermoanaerobaculia bacterium]
MIARTKVQNAIPTFHQGWVALSKQFPTGQTAMPTFYPFWVRLSPRLEWSPEYAYALKALAVAAAVAFARQALAPLSTFALYFVLPIFFLPVLLAWSASTGESVLGLVRRNITLIPAPQTENLSAREEIPRGTSTLILLNIVAFIATLIMLGSSMYGTLGDLVYPPLGSRSLVHPMSLLTSMFLHADLSHLGGNMVFLLGVGTVLEKRVGTLKFLSLYFLTGALGSIVSTMIYQATWGEVHSLGASGAISGIMGVVAVRCYATRMVWPIPIFGLLPISIKIRMSSLVLMGMFFFRDLGAGVEQLDGARVDNVGHWAHLAGMVSGIVVALLLRMGQEALEEKRITTGILSLEEGIGLAEGEDSLRAAVAANPQNLEAKLALARMKSRRRGERSAEAARLYQDVMARAITADPELAATAFLEYLSKYRLLLDLSLQLRLSLLLYRLRDLCGAARGLQLLADSTATPPDIREMAVFRCARIFDEMGREDIARYYYRCFAALFPRSPRLPKVFARRGIHLTPRTPY